MTAATVNPWRDKRAILAEKEITPASFKRRVRDGIFEKRKRPGGRGKEYRYVSAPTPAEFALLTSGARPETEIVDAALRHLTPEQQSAAKAKLDLIRPMLDYGSGSVSVTTGDTAPKFRNLDEVAQWIASKNIGPDGRPRRGSSVSTIWKFYTALKSANGDVSVLAKNPRPDRGSHKSVDPYPKLGNFLLATWADVDGNLAHVCHIVKREWGGSSLPYPKSSKPPSYSAIRRFITDFPEAIRDVALLPKQLADSKHAPYLVTGRAEHVRVNQVWLCDHRLYDVLVYNDCFPFSPRRWAAMRLWETCIQEMRTRTIVASIWNPTPSWRTIASALHQGIGRFGKPEIFYVDNGRDFRKIGAGAAHGSLLSTAEPELDSEGRVPFQDGLLARLGIRACFCIVRHPQSKQIESYFNFVSQRFDRLFFKKRGYTGATPSKRSDFCREAEKEHLEFLTGKRRSTPLVAASKFMGLHEQWLKEYNETHEHFGRGMNGQSPLDKMNELLPPEKRVIPDMLALEPLFWDVKHPEVKNCKVKMNNATYSAEMNDDQAAMEMFLANGKTIAVHCDPSNMARALAFEGVPNGRFLARLVSDELAIADHPVTEEAVKANARNRARLRKNSRMIFEHITAGVSSELERLDQRRLATGTDGAGNNFASARCKTTVPALPERATATAADFPGDSVKKHPDFADGLFD